VKVVKARFLHLFAGEKRTFQNGKTGSIMTSIPVRVAPCGDYDKAVVVEVTGHGYYTGEASFWMEEDDPVAGGFLVS
jgi:trans-L-3-hydroxyproline dehydratase